MHACAAALMRFMVALAACGAAPWTWAADDSVPVDGATTSAAPAAAPVFDFDIPAQPLVAALGRFADVSGRSALFPGTQVAGRRSTSVQGRYTAKAALQRLLEGSGLEVEEITSGKLAALVLRPVAAHAASFDTAADTDAASLGGYENLVQARVWDAICASRSAMGGSDRSLLRFSVDAAGRVHQPRLLGSSGNGRRDAALLDALRRIQLDRGPPPRMRQPVTMLILPEQAGSSACAAARLSP